MPVTVRNTDILFNDGTTLSSGNISVTPSTAQVLAATAGASAGAVGAYGFFYASGSLSPGATAAGSALFWGSAIITTNCGYSNASAATGGSPAGTWRLMGQGGGNCGSASLWLRIS